MDARLNSALQTLREHRRELGVLGVNHVAVFGSVARGEARADSDIDLLVDLVEAFTSGLGLEGFE